MRMSRDKRVLTDLTSRRWGAGLGEASSAQERDSPLLRAVGCNPREASQHNEAGTGLNTESGSRRGHQQVQGEASAVLTSTERAKAGSDSQEDNSPRNPEGKSKGDCQHRGKTGKLEPGRQKLQEGAEREGERLREEIRAE